jgi:hypothetical protein
MCTFMHGDLAVAGSVLILERRVSYQSIVYADDFRLNTVLWLC